MLGYNDLIDRLKRLDEDARLMINDANTYDCVIVGGSALILLGYRDRATYDIDVISQLPKSLIELMDKYDMNTGVVTYTECFPDDYKNRAIPINIETKKIKYSTISLEDLVISKLAASRDKDRIDITKPDIIKNIDWIKLNELANELKQGIASDWTARNFEISFNQFVKEYRYAPTDI